MENLEIYNKETYNKMLDIACGAHKLILDMFENNLYETPWVDTDYQKFQYFLDQYLPAVEYLKKFFNEIKWKSEEGKQEFLKYFNDVLYEDAKIFNLVRVRHEAYPIYKQFRKANIAELNKAMGFVKGGGKKSYIDVFDYFNDKCNKVPLFKPKKGTIKHGKVIPEYENTLMDWFYKNKFYKNIIEDINSSRLSDSKYDIDEVSEIFKQYVKCRRAVFSIFNMLTSADPINGYDRWHDILKQYCSCKLNGPALQKLYNAADCENEFIDVDNTFQKLDDASWRQRGIYESFDFNIATKIPAVLYHTENPYNRELILKRGLVPCIGSSYKCHYEGEENLPAAIFLSDYKYDSTYDDDIWEVDTSKLDLNMIFKDFDKDMEGCYVYTKRIPADALTLIYEGNETSDRAAEDWYKSVNESYVDDMIIDYNNKQRDKRSKKEIKSIKCEAHNSNVCKVVTDGKYVYAGTTFYPEDIVEICPTKKIDKSSLYSQDMRDIVLEVVPNTEWVLPFGYCQYYDIQDAEKDANCTFLWDPIKRVIVIKAINKIPKHCKLILKNN